MRSPSIKELFLYYFDNERLKLRTPLPPHEFRELYLVIDSMPVQELCPWINGFFDIAPDPDYFIPQDRKVFFVERLASLLTLLNQISNQAQLDIHKSNQEQNKSIAKFQNLFSFSLDPEMVKNYYLYCIFNPDLSKSTVPKRISQTERNNDTIAEPTTSAESLLLDLPYYGPLKPEQSKEFDLSGAALIAVEELRISGTENCFPLLAAPKGGIFLIEILTTTAPIWTAIDYDKKVGATSHQVTEPFQWTIKILKQKSDDPVQLRYVAKTLEERQFMTFNVYFKGKLD